MKATRRVIAPRSATTPPAGGGVNNKLAAAALGGNERARKRRGKLFPRNWVDRLLDPGSLSSSWLRWPLAACAATNPRARESSPGSAGYRTPVRDRRQRRDGQRRTYCPMTVKKHLRAPRRSRCEMLLPCIYPGRLRRLPAPPRRVFPDREHFGPDLLQPGDDERQGHSAGGGGSRLLHGGWRLCAGDGDGPSSSVGEARSSSAVRHW